MEFIKYNLTEIIITLVVIAVLFVIYYIVKSKKRRRKVGFYFNTTMYRLGLKKKISAKYIGMAVVKESYEPLVELLPHPKIKVNEATVEQPILLRKRVASRLYKIANALPDNVCLKIYSAYRSRINIYNIWREEVEKAEKENPNMGRDEMLSMLKYKVKTPDVNMGGHDTGAAIDLSLCDNEGNDLDFGTKYQDKEIPSKLTSEQKKNRKYLNKLMKSQGFERNPLQWWHYSYGDRYWSAYRGKRNAAVYGSAEKEFENTGYVRIVKTTSSKSNVK